MKKLLVTGGAGFIGSNFISFMLNKYNDYKIYNLDELTYAGNLENLKSIESNKNYNFIQGSICDSELVESVMELGIDYIVNFAAESHVDRSILDPSVFIKTNVNGTHVLLEVAKKFEIERFLQVSTDEVYGSLGDEGLFSEETSIAPNSPYSASKASADLLVRSYNKTFNLNTCITRCSNNYGPFQFPEKLIPLIINNASLDRELPIYGSGLQVRDWLHVYDHCSAIDVVLHRAESGAVYNIGGNNEKTNLDVVKTILKILNKSEDLIKHVDDRLGHDVRYAIDSSKLQNELGWFPKYTFEDGIIETVEWYQNNSKWMSNIVNGDYRNYYNKQYKK